MSEQITQTNKERLKEITDGIERGIKELFDSDRYRQYLSVMSRFHRYSVNNTMLIYLQRPDATLVAGFQKWKNQFGRHVKKGETGITIIAPTPFKKKIEEVKLDPDTQAPMLDQDGQQIMEEREISIPVFKPVKVFDVAQTDGKELPHLAATLNGSVEQYEVFVEALRRSAPVPISFKPLAPDMDGYFSATDQSITIREGMSQVQTISAMVHEIAHSKLHNYEKQQAEAADGEAAAAPMPKDRRTEEVEAESISYAVCQYYGIETSENSFGYIATWSKGKELKELRASLETINKTASGLISDIDRNFAEICKERGIDPKALPEQETQEPEQPETAPSEPAAPAEQEKLYLLDHARYLHIQTTDDGFDYSIYDAETFRLLDGGQFPTESTLCHATTDAMEAARREVCVREGMEPDTVEVMPLEMLETIQEANTLPEPEAPSVSHTAELIEHFSNEDADLLDTTLDEYPMPDGGKTVDDLKGYGYDGDDLLPVGKETASVLWENGFTVYHMIGDGGVSMCMDDADIDELPDDALFAIAREEWEESPEFREAVAARMERQEEREKAFLDHGADCFAIYQVKDGEEQRFVRFESLERLGRQPERGDYDLVYTAPLPEGADPETLFEQFNLQKPVDFQHPSMSVSDVVALKQDGKLTCHFCDSAGFAEVPGFLQPENCLKNAEMAMEDDANRIDTAANNNGSKQPTVAELEEQVKAGQAILLTDLADALHAEKKGKPKAKEEKPSILDRLKQPLPKQANKTAPQRSAERDR